MSSNNSANAFNTQIGKVVSRVEKFSSQSGQLFEIRWIEMNVLENGLQKKDFWFEVFPPLADNRTPDSIADVRECCVCLSLYHRESVFVCPVCGGDFCHICRGMIVENEMEIAACAACTEKANRGLFGRIIRRLWTLKD